MDEESIEKQKVAFIAQVELASELDLPLMLHIRNNEEDLSRNAYADVLEILKAHCNSATFSAGAENVALDKKVKNKPRGVVHFFAGTLSDAEAFIDFGFYISFAGVITYKPRKNLKRLINYEETIRSLPLAKIMADTDSPYVAPVPYRGQRNEPVYVEEIVKKIAEIKGLKEEEVATTILANAKNLFGI
jgi:TatD DNase family protein